MKKILITLLILAPIIFQTQVFSYSWEIIWDTKCSEINSTNRYQNLSPTIITKIDLIWDRINNKYIKKDNSYKEKIYNLYIKVLNQYLNKTKYSWVQKEVLLRIWDYFVCKKEWLKKVELKLNNFIYIDNIWVKSSGYDKDNKVENTLDWNLSTRWSGEWNGAYIEYDLKTIKKIYWLEMATYLWDERIFTFDILTSNDWKKYTKQLDKEKTNWKSLDLEKFIFKTGINTRYIKIIWYWNTQNNWNSITEVKFIFNEITKKEESVINKTIIKENNQNDIKKSWDLIFSHPNWILNRDEITEIKTKISLNKEPYKAAYNDLIRRAEWWMNKTKFSVRLSGDKGALYYSESPYCGWDKAPGWSPCGKNCCDGQFSPYVDRWDYKQAIKFWDAVRDLGMAYAFTNNSKYADKAIYFINAWCIYPSTKMTPKYGNWQSYIELFITMPWAFYWADLMWDYDGWNVNDKKEFLEWVKIFADKTKKLAWMTDPVGINAHNFVDWRMVSLTSMAVLLEDKELVDYVYEYAKKTLPHQIDNKGVFIYEILRTKGISYSSYALNAILQTAEALRHQWYNLYNYSDKDGRGSIKKAIDWLGPYMIDSSSWPYKQITRYNGSTDNAAAFEIANTIWDDPIIDNVIKKWSRPMYETRIAWSVTLTHGK